MVKPHSSNFRLITTNFWGVRIFRKFAVWWEKLKSVPYNSLTLYRLILLQKGYFTKYVIGEYYRTLVTRKLFFGVCNPVRHKLACTATEARLEISDTETRGIILSRKRTTKALIRLRICLCCSHIGINRFSHDVAHQEMGYQLILAYQFKNHFIKYS